jgi:hypothetical protein
MKTTADVIRGAREKLARPEKWLHETDDCAVDAEGRGCNPWAPEAVRWDLYGALASVAAPDDALDGAVSLCVRVTSLTVATPRDRFDLPIVEIEALVAWHDAPERTHAEVLLVLAIALVAATGKIERAGRETEGSDAK